MSSGAAECLLFDDPPRSGAWNMAVDEMLLEWVAQTGRAAWRWYAWEPATVSLGYFQDAADRALHPPSAECDWVRRATGGGAIVHDHEWTYSCVLPLGHPAARHRDRLYRVVHEAFIGALATAGLAAEMVCCPSAQETLGCAAADGLQQPGVGQPGVGQPGAGQPGAGQSYLCFQRRTPGDVLVNGHKILGSAQRRSARAVLQHGSFLLRRSQAAPELPGVCDLSEEPLDLSALRHQCLQRLGSGLSLAWNAAEWTPPMVERSTYWMGEQYAAAAWNAHRKRPVDNKTPESAVG